MSDLDKRIAELKGLWMKNWPFVCGNPEYPNETRVECDWSTSDSKALELVDEMKTDYKMVFISRQGDWFAEFFVLNQYVGGGLAKTRPEAICRAYIAAREWMATKGAEGAWRKDEEAKDKALRLELEAYPQPPGF